MITLVEFLRFRGFERLRADLTPHAYIVGPNSAGKSTILEAIGLAEQCLRIARRKTPTWITGNGGRKLRGFLLPQSIDTEEDPVRHDFGDQEARITVHWGSGSRIHIVWPEEKEAGNLGFFYLEDEYGAQIASPAAARASFELVTIVPVITPLDRIEELKSPTYVETHNASRLASRHFRNHVWLMSKTDQWDLFKEFCRLWLPEIELLDVSLNAAVNRLVVFYSEVGSRVPKELAWAGDGIQIWVQLLLHLFRTSGSATIVLDEPEVYLHPDLQRRLVRLLDSQSAQIILASHSAEVIAEAPPEGILWVDRRLGAATRVKSQKALSSLSAALGSSYNLALARSMRSRLVIATDCEDLRIIRIIAKNLGANNVANEQVVSMVQLREVSNWSSLNSVGESFRDVLPPKLPAVVLLQRGYLTEGSRDQLIGRLSASGVTVSVWSRTELENYLLDVETIARVSGASPDSVAQQIFEACSRLRDGTRSAFISSWVGMAPEGSTAEALSRAEQTFTSLWDDIGKRKEVVKGTHVIRELNAWLELGGYRTVSGFSLAKSIKPQSLPTEVLETIFRIEDALALTIK